MRIYKTLLAGTAAIAISSSAWADGGPAPEPAPPPPPPPEPAPAHEEPAPAPSHNDFVLVLELGAGWLFTDVGAGTGPDPDDNNFPLIEGAGRANVPLSDDWALQFDAEGLAAFPSRDDGEDNLQTAFSGAAHVNWRQPDHAIGILGHIGTVTGGELEKINFYNLGGEALYNWTDFTVLGQAGYFWADDDNNDDVMDEAWWVRGVGRFYAGADTRVQFEGAYGDGEERNSGGIDVTAISWGARIDHSVSGGPVAFFLSYAGNHMDNDDSADNYLTDHTVLAGLRIHFGDAGSLKESDRNGPSFDTPDVTRWVGWTSEVVE
ncbi:MAG: hypothetical protein ACLFWF_01390 [Alphaproteobacteria bacterium]